MRSDAGSGRRGQPPRELHRLVRRHPSNQPAQPYPWALAKVEDLDSQGVALTLPSSDWTYTKALAKPEVTAGNPQWSITVSKIVVLGPQDPVFFKFTGIKTDLDPGSHGCIYATRTLPGFNEGVLLGELEKTPLLYGIKRGQGLYISPDATGQQPPALITIADYMSISLAMPRLQPSTGAKQQPPTP